MIINNSATLEESGGDTFRARLISPGWGSSGYYSPDVLKAAAGLYRAGLKMFANHPTATERRELPDRDVSKIAGYLVTDGVYESHPHPGIYASVRILPKYQELVRHGKNVIGLSHIADGVTRIGEAEGKRGTIIEQINQVHSVDIVTTPGRGGKFCESKRKQSVYVDDSTLKLYESYKENMSPETARTVIETMTGEILPDMLDTSGRFSEVDEALIQSYQESGMRRETAELVVRRMTNGNY